MKRVLDHSEDGANNVDEIFWHLGDVEVVVVVGEAVDGGAGRGVVVGEGRPEVRKVGGEHVCENKNDDDDDNDND